MRRRASSFTQAAALLALTATLSFTVAGCGDDDVVSVGGFTFAIAAPGPNQLAGSGVICVPFTVSGSPGANFSILLQYALMSAPGSFITATEALPGSPGIGAETSVSSGVIPPGGITGVLNFYWNAPADLGPFGATGGDVRIAQGGGGSTPSAPGAFSFVPASAPVLPGASGATPGATAGAPPGGVGRAAQTAFNPNELNHAGTDNVVLAGGRNDFATTGLEGSSTNAFSSIDRFDFDLANLTYSTTQNSMGTQRTDHASSFFFDHLTGVLKLLVVGGTSHGAIGGSASGDSPIATADIYCFTPTEQVVSTSNAMQVPRKGHTATWAPNGRVYVFGGQAGPSSATAVIEAFDSSNGSFSTLGDVLANARRGHTATLLPNGKILIAGGFNPANATTPLPAELFDTTTNMMVVDFVPSIPVLDIFRHTATRLADGGVLLAGGQSVANSASFLTMATIFVPSLGVCGNFTPMCGMLTTGRSMHSATLLGDGTVLIAGGDTSLALNTTQSVELFLPTLCAFSPIASLITPRAEHSSTAVNNGTVVVAAGRNNSNLLGADSLEAFTTTLNTTPSITAASLTAGPAGKNVVNVTAVDPDNDGGYVVIRVRAAGSGNPWFLAKVATGDAGENGRLNAGGNTFLWTFGPTFSIGQPIDVQIVPVGATIGVPFNFSTTVQTGSP